MATNFNGFQQAQLPLQWQGGQVLPVNGMPQAAWPQLALQAMAPQTPTATGTSVGGLTAMVNAMDASLFGGSPVGIQPGDTLANPWTLGMTAQPPQSQAAMAAPNNNSIGPEMFLSVLQAKQQSDAKAQQANMAMQMLQEMMQVFLPMMLLMSLKPGKAADVAPVKSEKAAEPEKPKESEKAKEAEKPKETKPEKASEDDIQKHIDTLIGNIVPSSGEYADKTKKIIRDMAKHKDGAIIVREAAKRNVKIKIKIEGALAQSKNVYGYYSNQTNTLNLPDDRRFNAQTIVHELMHSLTPQADNARDPMSATSWLEEGTNNIKAKEILMNRKLSDTEIMNEYKSARRNYSAAQPSVKAKNQHLVQLAKLGIDVDGLDALFDKAMASAGGSRASASRIQGSIGVAANLSFEDSGMTCYSCWLKSVGQG